VLIAFGILFYRMTRPGFMKTPRSAVATGALLGLLLLARLDHGFFAAALLGTLAVRAIAARDGMAFRRAFAAGLVCSGILAVYLLWNIRSMGVLLPVSGTTKSTFPHLSTASVADFVSIVTNWNQWGKKMRLFRHLQMLLPMAAAVVALIDAGVRRRRQRTRPLDQPFVVTAIFVLLLGGYNLFFVHLMAQGHWYMPVSVVFTSLVTTDFLERLARIDLRAPHWGMTSIFALLVMAFFAFVVRASNANTPFRDFYYIEAPAVRAHYDGDPPRFVEYDDGVIAYFTGFPALSGFAFAIDKEGAEAYARRELLQLAKTRRFDRIASYVYMDDTKLTAVSTSSEIEELLEQTFHYHGGELSEFEFAVDYVSPTGRFCVIRFE